MVFATWTQKTRAVNHVRLLTARPGNNNNNSKEERQRPLLPICTVLCERMAIIMFAAPPPTILSWPGEDKIRPAALGTATGIEIWVYWYSNNEHRHCCWDLARQGTLLYLLSLTAASISALVRQQTQQWRSEWLGATPRVSRGGESTRECSTT